MSSLITEEVVIISGTLGGDQATGRRTPESSWRPPRNKQNSYNFRLADAATLYSDLAAAQKGFIYTAWAYNSSSWRTPCLWRYRVVGWKPNPALLRCARARHSQRSDVRHRASGLRQCGMVKIRLVIGADFYSRSHAGSGMELDTIRTDVPGEFTLFRIGGANTETSIRMMAVDVQNQAQLKII